MKIFSITNKSIDIFESLEEENKKKKLNILILF